MCLRYLSNLAPLSAGNAGSITLSLEGLGFEEGVNVELRAEGLPILAAEEVTVVNPTELFARFDLVGAALGQYTVYVIWPDSEEQGYFTPFEVESGIGPRLEVSLRAPEFVRPDRPFVVWLEYENTGDADLTAPLFTVSSPNAFLKLSEHEPFTSSSVQVLGVASKRLRRNDHPVGILKPGISYDIPIIAQTSDRGTMKFFAHSMVADATPIDWNTVEADIKPDDVIPETWNAMFAQLQANVGTTWADYLQMLSALDF